MKTTMDYDYKKVIEEMLSNGSVNIFAIEKEPISDEIQEEYFAGTSNDELVKAVDEVFTDSPNAKIAPKCYACNLREEKLASPELCEIDDTDIWAAAFVEDLREHGLHMGDATSALLQAVCVLSIMAKKTPGADYSKYKEHLILQGAKEYNCFNACSDFLKSLLDR